jgi:hypothetical protein
LRDVIFGPEAYIVLVLAEKHRRIRGRLRVHLREPVRILGVDPDRRQERIGEVIERDRGEYGRVSQYRWWVSGTRVRPWW